MQTTVRTLIPLGAGIHTLRIRQASGGSVQMAPLVVSGTVALQSSRPLACAATANLILLGTGVSLQAATPAASVVTAPLAVVPSLASPVVAVRSTGSGAVTVRVPMATASAARATGTGTVNLSNDSPMATASTAVLAASGAMTVAVPFAASAALVARSPAELVLGQLISIYAQPRPAITSSANMIAVTFVSARADAKAVISTDIRVVQFDPQTIYPAKRKRNSRNNVYEPVSLAMTQSYLSTSIVEENFRRITDLVGGSAYLKGLPYRVSHGRLNEQNFSKGQKFTNDHKAEPYSYFVQQCARPTFKDQTFELRGIGSLIPEGETYTIADARVSYASSYGIVRTVEIESISIPSQYEQVDVAGGPWTLNTFAEGESRQIAALVGKTLTHVEDPANDVIKMVFHDTATDAINGSNVPAAGPLVTITFKAKHVA